MSQLHYFDPSSGDITRHPPQPRARKRGDNRAVESESYVAGELPAGVVAVQAPRLEPQPWVKELWGWLATHTHGSARIDLRRPMPPPLNPHTDNLLFTSQKKRGRRGRGGRQAGAQAIRQQRGVHAYMYDDFDAPTQQQQQQQRAAAPSGMRLKISRHVRLFTDPRGLAKPWLDVGLGLNLDLDQQRLQPVARLKVKDFLSVKLVPELSLKLAKSLQLPGLGMQLKLLYELPLAEARHFWEPPARLLVRLDSTPGSGMHGCHITPAGVEFAGRAQLGRSLALIGAAGVSFPRQIPFDLDAPELGLQVHRLAVKSAW